MNSDLRDALAKALDEALTAQIMHLVEVLFQSTDDERLSFDRFKKGVHKTIKRHQTLLDLLNQSDL